MLLGLALGSSNFPCVYGLAWPYCFDSTWNQARNGNTVVQDMQQGFLGFLGVADYLQASLRRVCLIGSSHNTIRGINYGSEVDGKRDTKARSQSWCYRSLLNVVGVVAMISRIHQVRLGLIN